jgi:hypothetical protein
VPAHTRIPVWAVVEGTVDEAVLRRLAEVTGIGLAGVYGRNGKADLLRRLPGYNNAAHRWPWIVLVDLDDAAECAPPALGRWLPHPAPHMCLRVAVPCVEAWLMADRERFAAFLAVPVQRVPDDPEGVPELKRFVVGLARRSRRRAVREDMAPRPKSGRAIGPGYVSRLVDFSLRLWRPEAAAQRSESLRRCLEAMGRIAPGAQG